ncbi:MAG TPA: uracil-DNA glycosylase [Acidiphilium sp.]|nr:MAG: uracil-DNA glycosylase [Acidiphilium sp. 21-60-14]OYV92028.1 MAG: uracil-DNA glycosylase [Acidiphilium sp. 37-60-79]OZB39211.1 MAG: uracil-DNA glycosylase [Acidiphilium sp. 34-60-192]HQT88405.1 uracil-DNA glycosylase [Acidiphilium sp.]HQU23933.1 uracil-DNA glycosylase [Acidiphilium sp.]
MRATPTPDCPLCPRLAEFRAANRVSFSDWYNAPVPCFGPVDAELLIIGLAPGLRGANRTGRPFTGDYAGQLLYETLLKFDFAAGQYAERADDGLVLRNCRIVNAVRCVPPQNRPLPAEIVSCNRFLAAERAAMPNVRAIVALGGIAHQAVLRAYGLRQSFAKFGHGRVTTLPDGVILTDSFHVSRYNTNTKRLTTIMFEAIIAEQATRLRPPA